MSFNRTIIFAAASMLLVTPVLAEDMATPTGKSDTTTSGAMKSDDMKSGRSDSMNKSGSMKMKSGSTSDQGSSTPAGPAADTEKKM